MHSSVAEPHHFYAVPAPGENFDATPAPAPTLLYSKAKFLKRTKVKTHVDSVRFTSRKICTEWGINCYILCHFSIPNPYHV
jgi:hypothetical protein